MDTTSSDYQKYSLAFLLPQNVTEAAIEVSSEIAKQYDSLFTLGVNTFIPHVTICFNEYSTDSIEQLRTTAAQLASASKPVGVSFSNLFTSRGYIDVTINLSDELYTLHSNAIESLQPILKGRLRDKYRREHEYYDTWSDLQREMIRLYSHPDVMDNYRPHITFTCVEDENVAKSIIQEIQWPIKKCVLDSFALFEMGDYGSCQKIIEKFTL